jgi:polysaccharide export outer membrane protein
VESTVINSGDTIGISVAGQPELSGQFVVGADGTVTLPDVGAVPVTGLDQPRATETLTRRISQIIQNPQVSVVLSVQRIDVSILGEVRAPGKYQVKSGEGVVALIAMAGGLSEFANGDAIYLIRASEPKRIRFRMRDLSRGGTSATAFALRDGDLVVVE